MIEVVFGVLVMLSQCDGGPGGLCATPGLIFTTAPACREWVASHVDAPDLSRGLRNGDVLGMACVEARHMLDLRP